MTGLERGRIKRICLQIIKKSVFKPNNTQDNSTEDYVDLTLQQDFQMDLPLDLICPRKPSE